MNRNLCLSMVSLLVFGVAGCGRDTTPAVNRTSDISDAELQQIEEDEFRARETQMDVD